MCDTKSRFLKFGHPVKGVRFSVETLYVIMYDSDMTSRKKHCSVLVFGTTSFHLRYDLKLLAVSDGENFLTVFEDHHGSLSFIRHFRSPKTKTKIPSDVPNRAFPTPKILLQQ